MISRCFSCKLNQRVFVLLVAGLVFRGIIAFYLHPGFDEAYYYVYTLHLDWSYFDHSPLVALTTGFGTWITGIVSQFTIRLGALLLHTGTLIFLYLTSLKLFSKQAAVLALTIATLNPIFQIGFGILTLPDSPLMFFWSACLYWSACEFFPRTGPYKPTYRLTIIIVLVGLSCLGKYHGFVLGFGLVCFCLISHQHRFALISPWTILGCSLFIVIISPVLLWNAQHGWISFIYQLTRAIPSQEYRLTQLLWTCFESIVCLCPSLGLPMWWAILVACKNQVPSFMSPKSTDQLKSKYLLILCTSLPIVLGFTLIGGYKQILLTWPMPGFWGITLLLGYQASRWQQFNYRAVGRWLTASGLVIALILLVALAHISAGILQKPNTNVWFGGIWPIEADPFTRNIDIRQLRQGFIEYPALHQALQNADFIFTNQIFLAGQVAMALAPLSSAPITCFAEDLRGFAIWSKSDEWLGKDALYITSESFRNITDNITTYRNHFQAISSIGKIPLHRGGKTVEVFEVFQAKTLLKPYPRPY